MDNMTMEQKVDLLIRQNEELKFELERAKAVNEIQNLMSTYQYYHTAMRHDLVAELFSKNENVCCYMSGLGNWKGPEGIHRLFHGFFNLVEKDNRGAMMMHTLTTGVIVVADDGKTGKGIWLSPGHETAPRPDRTFDVQWAWAAYDCSFIKEDGQWKILTFRLIPIIKSPYDTDWSQIIYNKPLPDDVDPTQMPPHARADERNTDWPAWNTEKIPELNPVPPAPYATLGID